MLVQAGLEVTPPLEERRLADELEPRSELEAVVFEHGLERVLCDILCRLDLIRVFFEVYISLNEENVIDYYLSVPFLNLYY